MSNHAPTSSKRAPTNSKRARWIIAPLVALVVLYFGAACVGKFTGHMSDALTVLLQTSLSD